MDYYNAIAQKLVPQKLPTINWTLDDVEVSEVEKVEQRNSNAEKMERKQKKVEKLNQITGKGAFQRKLVPLAHEVRAS